MSDKPTAMTQNSCRILLAKVPKARKKAVLCSLVGHSNITEGCFGYVHCARCGAQIGDSLAGVYSNDKEVRVGHNCRTCRKNYRALTWRDKWMTPNPFKKEKR